VPIEFGFGNQFNTFSAQRLFTAQNSSITDVNFFVPGTTQAATTSAFGAIFTDVDVANTTRIDFFDLLGNFIDGRPVLASGGDGLFSFLGIGLDSSAIARVRITSGSATIVSNGVAGNPGGDLVVMDDFLYAEPRAAVPEPPFLAFAGLALLCAVMWSQRRRVMHSLL
jgi:hypothetical protein